jgi:DNA-binding SARP family transcriptional activator/ATP/maltotriose-dependent transcriptional regulator MalT
MPRSFRFEPPEPRPGSLTRPRLLRALLGRWEQRVTVVVGGPGLGKTTLLAQAVAENRLAPRGEDVWLGLASGDAEGDMLARDLLAAVASPAGAGAAGSDAVADRPDPPGPAAVADGVWRRSPAAVCLVIDDAHWLSAGSPGANWLAALVDALPANGHVLLASRWPPAVPLTRLVTQGAVLRLAEDDLRFSDEELAGFAARRGLAPERLSDTGGWPAMAELAASVEGALAGDYLWEEVLEPLGPDRRRVLATVSDLGGADDALASAALGEPVELAQGLAGVPLVARGAGGWRVPHPLWRTVRALALPPDERVAVRRRAIAHLTAGQRYDEAVSLAGDAGLRDMLPDILRAAAIGPQRPPSRRLDRWIAAVPKDAQDTPGAALGVGLRASLAAPAESTAPLRHAIRLCREAGDVDGELAAIALLGRVAWWQGDLVLLGELYPRVLELEAAGHPLAGGIAAVGRAVIADLEGDDDAVVSMLDAIEAGVLDPAWEAMADWMRATTLSGMGEQEAALRVLAGIPPAADSALQLTIEASHLVARWWLGSIDEVVAALPSLVERIRASGVARNLIVGLTQSAYTYATVGRLDEARRCLAGAQRVDGDRTGVAARMGLAEAAVLLADDDEHTAATVLEKVVQAHGNLGDHERRTWRHGLCLTYVLVPSTREYWDRTSPGGTVEYSRALSAAVVALREGRSPLPVDVSDPQRVRAALHHRFAVELALGLEACGRPEGGAILEALGPAGRDAVRAVAAGRTRSARPARSLLAAVPAPPLHTTEVACLGPLAIVRDGEVVTDPDLRRERVRALLAFLVSHRTTTRAAIVAALWPDLDEKAAANNLRVTLTYLLRLLEPWRSARESAYFVRFEGQAAALVTGERLRFDLDRFDDHVAQAARAEADGTPSLALGHHLAAVELYRGELHEGVPEADWLMLEREHFRSRFVAAATRAGQLLVGRGDPDQAEPVARRAVEVDPWAEEAYGVLVAVALARGDRTAARRALDRSLAALADLGVEPSQETQRLRRLVRGG